MGLLHPSERGLERARRQWPVVCPRLGCAGGTQARQEAGGAAVVDRHMLVLEASRQIAEMAQPVVQAERVESVSPFRKAVGTDGGVGQHATRREQVRQTIEAPRHVVLFCNGPWCGQSPTAIRRMIEAGFPADHISYYRGGMQVWRMLGLSVLVPQN